MKTVNSPPESRLQICHQTSILQCLFTCIHSSLKLHSYCKCDMFDLMDQIMFYTGLNVCESDWTHFNLSAVKTRAAVSQMFRSQDSEPSLLKTLNESCGNLTRDQNLQLNSQSELTQQAETSANDVDTKMKTLTTCRPLALYFTSTHSSVLEFLTMYEFAVFPRSRHVGPVLDP